MMMSVEDGDETVMQQRPRPRTQPIIFGRMRASILLHSVSLAICVIASFSLGLYLNLGGVLLNDVLPKDVSLDALTCSVWESGKWTNTLGSGCTKQGLQRARTMAFITLAFSELMRAFTVRQLQPFYVRPFRNTALLKAWLFSATTVLVVILVPGKSPMCGW